VKANECTEGTTQEMRGRKGVKERVWVTTEGAVSTEGQGNERGGRKLGMKSVLTLLVWR